jgi:hypothetical protein
MRHLLCMILFVGFISAANAQRVFDLTAPFLQLASVCHSFCNGSACNLSCR